MIEEMIDSLMSSGYPYMPVEELRDKQKESNYWLELAGFDNIEVLVAKLLMAEGGDLILSHVSSEDISILQEVVDQLLYDLGDPYALEFKAKIGDHTISFDLIDNKLPDEQVIIGMTNNGLLGCSEDNPIFSCLASWIPKQTLEPF